MDQFFLNVLKNPVGYKALPYLSKTVSQGNWSEFIDPGGLCFGYGNNNGLFPLLGHHSLFVWTTMIDNALPTIVDHGWQCFCQPWLTMVDNAFANHGQPWLSEVPFHIPMVDHGLEKLCQTMVNHDCQSFLAWMVDDGWLEVPFPAFSQWKPHGWTMPSLHC